MNRAMAAVAVTLLAFNVPFTAQNQTVQPHPQETHLRNVRQLTSGGENAEA
jgi:hypothetical protein